MCRTLIYKISQITYSTERSYSFSGTCVDPTNTTTTSTATTTDTTTTTDTITTSDTTTTDIVVQTTTDPTTTGPE